MSLGRKLKVMETKRFLTEYPDLLSEWDYDRNGSITPYGLTIGSGKKVWWKCSKCGNSWDATISNRKRGTGCPYCSIPAKKVLQGFNDLKTKYPEIAREWHPTRNGEKTPDSVLCGSAKKVWWLCERGHEYEQSIINRVNGGNCPYCSHQKLLEGFNDFATEHPELLGEWDTEKNTLKPNSIMSHSHYKAWWKCPFGHSYQAWMDNRCGTTHSGCPICDKENHTSFPEQALYYYVKKSFPDAINSDKSAIGMELDIYIPSLRVAIEYDGKNWHSKNEYELEKNSSCKRSKIRLIRVRESGLKLYNDCVCLIRDDNRTDESLSSVIEKVLAEIGASTDIDIDVKRDAASIYSSYIKSRKEQSLLSSYPDLSKEWHPTKNGRLSPEMVAPMTNKKVWWLGACGHEWMMSVQDRTNQNCGCPVCSGKRIIPGENDLLSQYPELCKEWDYEKNSNNGLYPNIVAPHSDKKVWWKCSKCGYEWNSKIDSRTRMQAGCPECGRRIASEAKYKAVRCVETGTVYMSLKDASEKTGISRSCITSCCKGKQKTAGKYHWEYI